MRFTPNLVHPDPHSGGAVETSAVHHGRVCPACRMEPIGRRRVSVVSGLQAPSWCASRVVFPPAWLYSSATEVTYRPVRLRAGKQAQPEHLLPVSTNGKLEHIRCARTNTAEKKCFSNLNIKSVFILKKKKDRIRVEPAVTLLTHQEGGVYILTSSREEFNIFCVFMCGGSQCTCIKTRSSARRP